MVDAKKERRARIKASLQDRGEYKFDSQAAEQEAASVVVQAEKDLAECHVNFRWQREQLDLVKKAAEEIGVPYQTYIKLCVFRQAKQDLGITASDAASKAEFDLLRSLVQANEMKIEAIMQSSRTSANVQLALAAPSAPAPAMGYAAMAVPGPNTSMYQASNKHGFIQEACPAPINPFEEDK